MRYRRIKFILSVLMVLAWFGFYFFARNAGYFKSYGLPVYFIVFFGGRVLISTVQNKLAKNRGEELPYPWWMDWF